MKETSRVLANELCVSFLLFLDLVADLAFLAHLWRHDFMILFYVSTSSLALSLFLVNILAFIGISETAKELTSSELEFLELGWLWQKYRIALRSLCLILIFSGFILPQALICLNLVVLSKCSKVEEEDKKDAVVQSLRRIGAASSVKEVQSVTEAGVMIYLKCFYIFLYALLFSKNWPLLFGLSLNIVSMFFGLRKHIVSTSKWPFMAIIVAFVNLVLRLIIILVLATATREWFCFLPPAISVILMFFWGLYLRSSFTLLPAKMNEVVKKSAPKSYTETMMSSIMYTFFLVPEDAHTAVSILPFTASSIAIACLNVVPIGLRCIMPVAGTLGQIPPKFWWKLTKN